jgi:hypothetical protein
MTDINAVAGFLSSYRTLADGSLRIVIDLPEIESLRFHGIFPRVNIEVAVIPLKPGALEAAQKVPQSPGDVSGDDGQVEQSTPDGQAPPIVPRLTSLASTVPKPEPGDPLYQPHSRGEYARELRLSGFFNHPEVWRAAGTDTQFLKWLRGQKCVARAGTPCEGDVVPAHVWRLSYGFGKGEKGPYAAVPMCHKHHSRQHALGEGAIGGREYMERARDEALKSWVWERIREAVGVRSMAAAEPRQVLVWAQKHGVAQFLPDCFQRLAA